MGRFHKEYLFNMGNVDICKVFNKKVDQISLDQQKSLTVLITDVYPMYCFWFW